MPVQQARARSRQQRILRAAADVIARRGYRAAAVDEIARAADTSKGGLYFHFSGKEALLLALLDHTAARLRTKVEIAIAAETEPIAKADAALHVLLRAFGKHRALARVFAVEARAAGGTVSARIAAIQDEFAALVEEQLDRAVADGSIEPIDTAIVAQAWVGMLQAVIGHWATSRDRVSLDVHYLTVRRLLLRSIGADSLLCPEPAGRLPLR